MKRLVIVGAGHRCYDGFAKRITETCSDKVEIVAVCDNNAKRCEYFRDTLNRDMRIYSDFDAMLETERPDAVLVATPDYLHHEYIIKALKFGCDVFSEKPLTVDEEKCLAIREAERETGRRVTLTFNCRFVPYFAKLKELIKSGIIGRPLAIHYEYLLHTQHGGDYFRRWHRFMEKSGGMMVHKATHHFDIVNWLLDDEPVSVSAQGARLYFGNGGRPHGERCSECAYREGCEANDRPYDNEFYKKMYFECEGEDGYIRDHCSFAEDTDIYDSMSVSVAYKGGALLTYSLNLFSTDGGYNINVIGEKGRLEASSFFEGDEDKVIVRYRDGRVDELTFPRAGGTHWGGDEKMIAMLFGGFTDDPLGQCSDSFDGIKSAMIGIAANKSIKDGVRVELTPILDKMR